MNGTQGQAVPSAAARLLVRERCIAAIEAGQSQLLALSAPGDQLVCVHAPLLADAARIGLVIVPDRSHPLCHVAVADGSAIPATTVSPEMTDAERRDLGLALRNHTVQLLLVTPERLAQPRFVQFVRERELVLVGVASCQRMDSTAADYVPAYETLRAIPGLFPGVPILALTEGPQSARAERAIMSALGFPSAPPAPPAPAAPAAPAAPPAPPAPVAPSAPAAFRAAFPLFEREVSLADAAQQLDRDAIWVARALAAYLRHTGRTHPFPWIDKPVYLAVAMIAGQAESTEPRLILSLLKDSIGEAQVLPVLAALDNRKTRG